MLLQRSPYLSMSEKYLGAVQQGRLPFLAAICLREIDTHVFKLYSRADGAGSLLVVC